MCTLEIMAASMMTMPMPTTKELTSAAITSSMAGISNRKKGCSASAFSTAIDASESISCGKIIEPTE